MNQEFRVKAEKPKKIIYVLVQNAFAFIMFIVEIYSSNSRKMLISSFVKTMISKTILLFSFSAPKYKMEIN